MTERTGGSDLSLAFEAQAIDNTTFHHAEHVEVAYGLLKRYDFIDAAAIYAKGIRSISSRAGAPEKFNLTITYAFMSLIAERMTECVHSSFERFADANPDLMSSSLLAKWYSAERLYSKSARRTFLLPHAINTDRPSAERS